MTFAEEIANNRAIINMINPRNLSVEEIAVMVKALLEFRAKEGK